MSIAPARSAMTKPTDDGIPEMILIDERSKRATRELCGDQREGHRCILNKGHEGVHESLATQGVARWSRLS
jgi:hypothetical protein